MQHVAKLCLALPFTLLAACGSSSSDGGGTAPLTLALTDAAADEVAAFNVEIESIVLRRAGGGVVSVLDQPVTVDLVTLQDLSQVLAMKEVPLGNYTGATITFDFDQASAFLVDETTAAALVDGSGAPLTGLVEFDATLAVPMQSQVGSHRLLELDFDLDQSLTVDTAGNSIAVEPMLVLDVDPANPKELIVMGELVSVDALAGTFVLDVQTLTGASLGEATVAVVGQALYQIDGVMEQGVLGLADFANVPMGTWVQCYGAIAPGSLRFVAGYVEAGAGTYNGGQDIVEGHILARSGGSGANATLTVLGHSNDATHTAFQFNRLFTVATSFANTKVFRTAELGSYDADHLNVGQRVRIFGDLSGTNLDASGTTGIVRLQPTRVLGFANGAPGGGLLEVDVVRLGLVPQSLFTWSQGGALPPDPDFFQCETGTLTNSLTLTTGSAVEVLGWMKPVGDTGEDFEAVAVVDRDSAPSLALVRDRLFGHTVSVTTQAIHIEVVITGSASLSEFAVVDRGFVGVLPLPSSPNLLIEPAGSVGIYTLIDKGTGAIDVHTNFADFSTAVGVALGQGADLLDIGAIGVYDSIANSIASSIVSVVVQ